MSIVCIDTISSYVTKLVNHVVIILDSHYCGGAEAVLLIFTAGNETSYCCLFFQSL